MSTIRAFCRLDRIDRRLILEALVLVTLVRASIVVLRFTTLRRGAGAYVWLRSRGSRACDRRVSAGRVAWAVNAVARRLPVRTSCLVDAIAADAMLRRRGFASAFRVGVRRPDRRPLDAHAWVECEGEVVVGGVDELAAYAILAPRS